MVRKVLHLISSNYSSRYSACNVQAGYEALGKVHLCHLHWTKRWRKLYCVYIQTMWVSVYTWSQILVLRMFGHVCLLCIFKCIYKGALIVSAFKRYVWMCVLHGFRFIENRVYSSLLCLSCLNRTLTINT